MSYDIDELIAHNATECCRITNGKCYTRRCLLRGGWQPGYSEDLATCEAWETIAALSELRRLQNQ